jgi:FlaA1/EpsC-like NDP-sugar epimerase
VSAQKARAEDSARSPNFAVFPTLREIQMSTADLKSDHPTAIGQKALVTGANSGIGRTVAIDLGQAGADVVVNYVAGEDRAQEVLRTIERHGVKAYAHLADVSNEAQVRDMFSYDGEAAGYDRHPRQQCRTAM